MSRKAGWIGTLSLVLLLGIVFSTQAARRTGSDGHRSERRHDDPPVGTGRPVGHHRPRR